MIEVFFQTSVLLHLENVLKRSNVRDSDAQIEVSHNTISLSSH